jgi:hypothetical protein
LHEHWVEGRWEPRNRSAAAGPPTARSDANGVEFDDPASVASVVLGAAPDIAIVYPTEQYYYYRLDAGPRSVSGNLRFCDIDAGLLSVGYFDVNEPWQARFAQIGPPDLTVEPLGSAAYRLTFRGVQRVFVLSDLGLRPSAALALAEREQRVSGILDESGYFLDLIWNDEVGAFYYLLRADAPLPERLVPLPGKGRYWIGSESRFVFLEDPTFGRRVLVGVLARNVRENNYFDGPFDQVPPRLIIRDKLLRAYPYAQYRGGIDEHGVFRRLEGQRVAISPYQQYETLDQIVAHLDAIVREHPSGPELWTAATRESKQGYDPMEGRPRTLGDELGVHGGAGRHAVFLSHGWPANHTGPVSGEWPSSHSRDQSSDWPPNHRARTSDSVPDPTSLNPGEHLLPAPPYRAPPR